MPDTLKEFSLSANGSAKTGKTTFRLHREFTLPRSQGIYITIYKKLFLKGQL